VFGLSPEISCGHDIDSRRLVLDTSITSWRRASSTAAAAFAMSLFSLPQDDNHVWPRNGGRICLWWSPTASASSVFCNLPSSYPLEENMALMGMYSLHFDTLMTLCLDGRVP
jgi:hypothetical protein